MKTDEALEVAIRLLREFGNSLADEAAERLEAIQAQQGCEHFDSAGDGSLTMLIDIIIDG
jgi:hypothetical protein